ncbi:MAG TPA: DUF3347 domain-containing protein [Chitinophagaceae bacterium]
MKKALVLILLLVIAVAVWFFVFRKKETGDAGPELQPVSVSQHSDGFNQSFQKMLDNYYTLTDAFVNWDTSAVNKAAMQLKTSVDSLQMQDLQKDTIIFETAGSYWNNAQGDLDKMIAKNTIAEKREVLNTLSDNLYNLFRTVRYDQAKVYWQECPMAFNETESGFWLSKTDLVQNPYLGTKHPKYGKAMLECGGPKDTLNFMASQTN